MKELVVGADGFVGSNLMKILPEAQGTSRGFANYLYYDLLDPAPLPKVDVAYICAAVNGFEPCEGNRLAYRANVDGTIKTARNLVKDGAFVVWISSCSVEWVNTDYARQKSLVEIALMCMDQGIVRAGRVYPGNVEDLCNTLIRVGRKRIEGVTLWNVIDSPYYKKQ